MLAGGKRSPFRVGELGEAADEGHQRPELLTGMAAGEGWHSGHADSGRNHLEKLTVTTLLRIRIRQVWRGGVEALGDFALSATRGAMTH